MCTYMCSCVVYLFAFHLRGGLVNQSELAEVAVTLYCVLNMNRIPGIAAPPQGGEREVKRNEINSCSDTHAHSIIQEHTHK